MKRKFVHIPNEIVSEEILPRLPVRSLLRFRCVSKPWCASISDPNFSLKAVAEHIAFMSDGGKNNYNLHIADEKSFVDMFPVSFANDKRQSRVQILSSSGGLLLLLLGDDIFLVNPSTRDVKWVSSFPPDMHIHAGGLCCDPVTRNYKMIVMIRYQIFKVFSFSSRTWKEFVSDDLNGWLEMTSPVNVSGRLYFLAFKKAFVVIYFDSENDQFTEMWIPELLSRGRRLSIGKLKGCLALTCSMPSDHKQGKANVWVMKGHGERESWTNLFRIEVSGICAYSWLKPLLFTNDGEVLFQVNNERLVACNLKEQSCKEILVPPGILSGRVCLGLAFTYLPSLIPPPYNRGGLYGAREMY